MKEIKRLLYSTLKPYASVLFLDSPIAGFVLLAISFSNPSVAISGILAVIFTILFATLIGLKEASLAQGFYIYNSLLTGMGIGFLFSPSFTSIILIAISAIFTFMLSFMLNRLFSHYKIPILSLPFSMVTMFIYLASLKYSGLLSTLVNNATLYDIELPLIIAGFFKSLGTIFFLPNVLSGLLISVLIIYFSRIVFIMGLVGFYFGIFIHSFFIGSFTQALHDPYAFNYILVAIALCGVFLLPTIKNFFLALLGVAISVVLTDAISVLFNSYGIPVFTLPFNITVIVFIFILSIIYYNGFNLNIKSSPEASLSHYLSRIFRFGKEYTKISLPFSGEWVVYQAFDGEWTHKGVYQYAYDFVKHEEGKSHQNEGLYAKDYYAFGQSILAPTSGYIVDLRQDLIDNNIGEIDRINNWGNYIIMRSDLGFFVEISHLMKDSISVNVGDYIQINSIIAKCGNSGYSPEPHIHIQVQDFGIIGGFTKKFTFSEYIQDKVLFFNQIPKQHEKVKAVINDKSISSRFIYILDDTFDYDVFKDNIKIDEVTFSVKMNALGEFYLTDKDENKLFFYNDLKQFYFYHYTGKESHLKWLFIISPRFPFARTDEVVFSDYLPAYLIKNTLKSIAIELLCTLHQEFYRLEVRYRFDNHSIHSKYGSATIEPSIKGYDTLSYKNITLRSRR